MYGWININPNLYFKIYYNKFIYYDNIMSLNKKYEIKTYVSVTYPNLENSKINASNMLPLQYNDFLNNVMEHN